MSAAADFDVRCGVTPHMRASGEAMAQAMLDAGTSIDVGLIYATMRRASTDGAHDVDAAIRRAYGFLWHGAINTGVAEQGTLPVVSAAAEARRALCKALSRDDQLRAIEDVRAEIWGTGEVRS